MDGCNVGGSAHRDEVAVELVGGDVLGLVDFQKEAGGIAYDVAGRMGTEKHLTGAADAKEAAAFENEVWVETLAYRRTSLRRDMLIAAWGWKVGAAFMEAPPVSAKASEEMPLSTLGGDFVLASLAGDHDGEGEALATPSTIEDGLSYPPLVGPQGVDGLSKESTPAVMKRNWRMAAIVTKKKEGIDAALEAGDLSMELRKARFENGVESSSRAGQRKARGCVGFAVEYT